MTDLVVDALRLASRDDRGSGRTTITSPGHVPDEDARDR